MQISYFPHDSNARNSDKLLPVRMKYGAEGYGIYFMLIERLRDEPSYMSIKDYNMLAFDLRVDAQKIKAVIEDFGLFSFTDDGKCFYSEGFIKRMKIKDSKSKARSDAGKKGAEKRWNKGNDSSAITKPSQINGNAMAKPSENIASKVNKSKVNKNNKDKRSKPKKRVYEPDSDYFKLAQYLWEKIKANNPENNEPNLQTWSDDIRKMAEIDHRDVEKIHNMIDWCQSDDFWSTNILSAKKLREKYEQMRAQANKSYKRSRSRRRSGVTEKATDWSKVKSEPIESGLTDAEAEEQRVELLKKLREKAVTK